MTEYSLAEAANILNLSRARLRYWERTSLIRATGGGGDDPAFGFQDLVCIRTVLALLDHGVPLRRIRRSVERFRTQIPELDQPLGALRVWVEGSERVVVRHDGALVEPSGQLVLDLDLAPERPDDVATLRPVVPVDGEPDPQTALEWFERGCQLDGERSSYPQAIEAYENALRADPDFADAHCNLGTLHYNRGNREAARHAYERALEADPEHVEARFNLANVLEEEGRNEAALVHYKAAMRADPTYPDVQLNLALLYEKLGLPRKAREHWRRYLQLAPRGNWSDLARERLDELN